MIVGFFGQSEAGKDTAADYLVNQYGFVKVAFADVMKRIAMEIYDFTPEQLWGSKKNEPDLRYPIEGKGFLTPRAALQVLGTEIGRSIFQDTWAAYTMRAAEKVAAGTHKYSKVRGLIPSFAWMTKKPAGIVISDVRFLNEIKCIHTKDGIVIRLNRAGKDGNIVGGIAGHASETDMKSIPDSEVDAVVNVPEGILNFHAALDAALMKIPAFLKSQKG